MRVDVWLFYARLCRSRTLATKLCATGRTRVNQKPVKPHHLLKIGDELRVQQQRVTRVLIVQALGERRGPASEARELYHDLTPPAPLRSRQAPPSVTREPGAGRPTKSQRRAIDRLRRD